VRQSAAESKIVQFPAARSAGRNIMSEDEAMDQTRKLPIGLCLMIWTALAVAGWSVFNIAFRLV
jgi:hypothetical protein